MNAGPGVRSLIFRISPTERLSVCKLFGKSMLSNSGGRDRLGTGDRRPLRLRLPSGRREKNGGHGGPFRVVRSAYRNGLRTTHTPRIVVCTAIVMAAGRRIRDCAHYRCDLRSTEIDLDVVVLYCRTRFESRFSHFVRSVRRYVVDTKNLI